MRDEESLDIIDCPPIPLRQLALSTIRLFLSCAWVTGTHQVALQGDLPDRPSRKRLDPLQCYCESDRKDVKAGL
jgi:hypothetical protein